MKNRKPQGRDDDFEIVQVSIQIESNLRLGFEHKLNGNLYCGSEKDFNDFEKHSVTFEKYVRMPLEMRVKKEKIMEEALKTKEKLQDLKHEE